MTRKFILVKAIYPRKSLYGILLVALLIGFGLLNSKFHITDKISEPLLLICGIAFGFAYFYIAFMVENFKRIGDITFANDHIVVNQPGENKQVFNLRDMKNVEFLYKECLATLILRDYSANIHKRHRMDQVTF